MSSIASTELSLYAFNDNRDAYMTDPKNGKRTFYPSLHQRRLVWAKNQATKKARGNYSAAMSLKAWMRWTDEAAKKYAAEFGSRGDAWNKLFDKEDRLNVAKEAKAQFEEEYREGYYESVIPKKYQKRATKKSTEEAFKKLASERNRSIGHPARDRSKRDRGAAPAGLGRPRTPKRRHPAAEAQEIAREDPSLIWIAKSH